MHFLFTSLRIALAVGLLLYLSISGAIDWSTFSGLTIHWPLALMVLVLLLGALLIQAMRLCMLLRPQSMYLSFYSSVKLTLIGTFFNSCLPGATGGDVIKIYYATEGNHGRRTEIATLILFDRIVGLFALLIFPLLLSPLFLKLLGSIGILRSLLWTSAVVASFMVAVMLICLAGRLKNSRFLAQVFQKLPLGNYIKRMFDTLSTYRHNENILLTVVGMSLLAHAVNVTVILFLAVILNPLGPSWEMSLLIPLGFLATTLPVTPGGIGVGEAAFNGLFGMAGLGRGAELLLGWRLLTLMVGLIGLGFYLKGRRCFGHEVVQLGVSSDPPQRTIETKVA